METPKQQNENYTLLQHPEKNFLFACKNLNKIY